MSKNDRLLLRRYIKESLLLEKSGGSDFFSSVTSGAKGMLGFGDGKSGPQKWFAKFIDKQLDQAGEKIDKWLGKKLDDLLPDETKTALATYEKESGESYSTSLTKVVDEWIKDIEDMADAEFNSAQKKEIYEFASKEYAAILKKDSDVKKALLLIKRKLDMKYGTLLSKDKSKAKKGKTGAEEKHLSKSAK